jgi:hypothetical protein
MGMVTTLLRLRLWLMGKEATMSKTVNLSLPWWRKDALGWPIETFKGKPVKSAIRIICQNIRKVIFKPNVKNQTPPPMA